MYFCFTDAILSKVCKTKFSNTSFEVLLPVLKYVMRFPLNSYYHNVLSLDLWIYVAFVFDTCFKNMF